MTAPTPMPVIPKKIIRKLNDAGFEAYAVGGCVRDVLLGRTPLDFDITTSALPEEVRRVFADCHVIDTGIQHGTVTVVTDSKPVEITTYRVDGGYTDSRHPDAVAFTPSLLEDLKRRDFTVNAMVWHPDTGIADHVGGIEDLNSRVLRCVGDPDRRLTEDALRILRALRFAAVYQLRPEVQTADAMRRHRKGLLNISAERIQSELFRLLCGCDAAAILEAHRDIFAVILPEIFEDLDEKAIAFTLKSLALTPPTLPCRLAILLQHHQQEAVSILRRLKTDNDTLYTVKALLDADSLPLSDDPVTLKRALHRLGEFRLRLFLSVQKARAQDANRLTAVEDALDRLLKENPCYSLEQLQISGNDLLALGFSGPAVGKAIDTLLQRVMEETAPNDRVALTEIAKSLPRIL